MERVAELLWTPPQERRDQPHGRYQRTHEIDLGLYTELPDDRLGCVLQKPPQDFLWNSRLEPDGCKGVSLQSSDLEMQC